MVKEINHNTKACERIFPLEAAARNHLYSNANKQSVMVRLNKGKAVTDKLNIGNWGGDIVPPLADYVPLNLPGLSKFNLSGNCELMWFSKLYVGCEIKEPQTRNAPQTIINNYETQLIHKSLLTNKLNLMANSL